MKNNKLVVLIGETVSGKDTVLRYLITQYGLKPVCSHTTRQMRSGEEDGVQHWFDTKEEFDKMLRNEKVIAYTKIEDKKTGKKGYEYCATVDNVKDADIYILDPNGVSYFEKWHPEIKLIKIYVTAAEDIRYARALERDASQMDKFVDRVANERTQFELFNKQMGYDYKIVNENLSLSELFEKVDACLHDSHYLIM